MKEWYNDNAHPDFMSKRIRISRLLQEEGKLLDIVKLIGSDILPDEQKLVLEAAKAIRQGFLQQNAYHEEDTYVPILKQYCMMDTLLKLYDGSLKLVSLGIPVSVIKKTGVFDDVIKIKYTISNDNLEAFETLNTDLMRILDEIEESYKGAERSCP
ncbi:TPA: hypothetical protein ENS27_00765 [bacterium]|nr:hypothetical protein [bacterium]